MTKWIRLLMSIPLCIAPVAYAQEIDFPRAAANSDAELIAVMPSIAEWTASLYTDEDRMTHLDNLFRMQIVARRYAEADQTIEELRLLRRTAAPFLEAATLPYEVYVEARKMQVQDGLAFDDAFSRAFRNAFARLDDQTAAHQARWVFGTSPIRLRADLMSVTDQLKDQQAIDLPVAVDLVRKFLAVEAYEALAPLIAGLLEEDDHRRYIIEKDVLVEAPQGATICTLLVRPRSGPERLPALLNFTIYADPDQNMNEARRTASHGYAGVEGLTRGKGCSSDEPVPIEHDGEDAAALIDWISSQEWSDGRVGMYGGSYEGFTQWAGARHLPQALKAIMPSVTFAPGIDFPMDGNVFMNYAYPWSFYVTNGKGLDNATYFDSDRWTQLNREWYASGRPYRDLDEIDGAPNPIFDRWLDHPDYDAYWQGFIPYHDQFARITIPVLTTTGYYDSGQLGALYYFREHHEHNPSAEHYLLIGPYDHVSGQRGTISPLGRRSTELRGYELDSIAHIDIGQLRYEWFDYVLRGGPRPALLEDAVNYQVMGANHWKHAPSLEAMHGPSARFYLTDNQSGNGYRLGSSPTEGFVRHVVDLADRTDLADTTDLTDGTDVAPINQALDTWNIVAEEPNIANGILFLSDPLETPPEISGLFSGRLNFITNKKDFDFTVTLYELTPRGKYIHLSYYWARASYVRDRSRRQLLPPGKSMTLAFESGRLTSRQFQSGSRLAVVLGILKQPELQINYGTGRDVSDETIADAGAALEIQWFGDSFIDVPAARGDDDR
jgi:putative CocE/NonD family hydrolase